MSHLRKHEHHIILWIPADTKDQYKTNTIACLQIYVRTFKILHTHGKLSQLLSFISPEKSSSQDCAVGVYRHQLASAQLIC